MASNVIHFFFTANEIKSVAEKKYDWLKVEQLLT